jgi:hypothetical protein
VTVRGLATVSPQIVQEILKRANFLESITDLDVCVNMSIRGAAEHHVLPTDSIINLVDARKSIATHSHVIMSIESHYR